MNITITSVGPTRSSFSSPDPQHSWSGRALCLTLAAGGLRMYAGTYAGVWRSDDGGRSWHQLTWPQPDSSDVEVPGAIQVPHIHDLAVSPGNADLVLAAGSGGQFAPADSRDGIYRTADGGATWARVHTVSEPMAVSQIVFAPDDPDLVYAAVGNAVAISTNAGVTWTVQSVGGAVWHVAVAPKEPSGRRRVYAAGDDTLFGSLDGGASWRRDTGADLVRNVRQALSDFIIASGGASRIPVFAGRTADTNESGTAVLAIEPGHPERVYLAAPGGTTGPVFYDEQVPDGTLVNTTAARLASEGSLWLGDFTNFENGGSASWEPVPGPPIYQGGGMTRSGVVLALTKPTSIGFLLFFADASSVFVAAGKPTATASWHRLDGRDASVVQRSGHHENQVLVHADPHALATTPDFEITLGAAVGVSSPYNQNSELAAHVSGSIWLANDGGVYRSDNGGQLWERADGLDTTDPVNIAGLHGSGTRPALYMGCVDNDDFFTRDGGSTWGNPLSACGDCDAWFADTTQRTRVLEFDPRGAGLRLISIPAAQGYPDAASLDGTRGVPRPRSSNASAGFVVRGFRPIVQTLASEAPLADGDYVFTSKASDGANVLLRTRAISSITAEAHWDDPAKAERIGPPLPLGADLQPAALVQVSGGHQHPVFYTADGVKGGHLWRLNEARTVWEPIAPGGPPGSAAVFARRYFVDPYNPLLIYLHDNSGIKLSPDGGGSWLAASSLSDAMTAGGKLPLSSDSLIRDMLFVREEPLTRFAFGSAGVACTVNGFDWFTLLNATAFPGCPETGFFDPVSDPANRTLYVAVEGRSVLRLRPVPPPPPVEEPPVFDLFEFAAVLADA